MQDFGGFRVVAIIPRHKPNWPAPGVYEEETPKRFKDLGAASNPLPVLLPGGKAISAATVRLGLGWMEIPFVATQVLHLILQCGSYLFVANPCELSTEDQADA